MAFVRLVAFVRFSKSLYSFPQFLQCRLREGPRDFSYTCGWIENPCLGYVAQKNRIARLREGVHDFSYTCDWIENPCLGYVSSFLFSKIALLGYVATSLSNLSYK